MTDEEIICGWMEPLPAHTPDWYDYNDTGWWIYGGYPPERPIQWHPKPLTLDRLHEVEKRLTDKQWNGYLHELWVVVAGIRHESHNQLDLRIAVHLANTQKIKALAAVLRKEAE